MTSERNEQDRLLDELLKGCKSPEDIPGKHGVLRQMTKRMVERALAAEMTEHLGYAPHERGEQPRPNTRNGSGTKTGCVARVTIGVGNGAHRPLPPNPVCGSPATGSPVGGVLIGIGTPSDGLRTS